MLVVDGAGVRYVLRRFRRNPQPARIAFQLRFQQHLLDAGLPVPTIVPARGGDPLVETADGRWALFSYLAGEYFDFERPAQIDQAARTLARFHLAAESFDQPEAPHELKLDVRRYWTHGAQVRAELEELYEGTGVEQELGRFRDWLAGLVQALPLERYDALPGRWVHGDYHGRNLHFRGDRVVGLFDFDLVLGGPWALDLAYAVFMFGRERRGSRAVRPEVAARFVDAYAELRPLEPGERDAVLHLMGWRAAPYGAFFYRWVRRQGLDHVDALRRDIDALRAEREQAVRLAPVLLGRS